MRLPMVNGRRRRLIALFFTDCQRMVDLSISCGGIRSPNPFWLASGPLTNSACQVCKVFERRWDRAVWKTLSEAVMVPMESIRPLWRLFLLFLIASYNENENNRANNHDEKGRQEYVEHIDFLCFYSIND